MRYTERLKHRYPRTHIQQAYTPYHYTAHTHTPITIITTTTPEQTPHKTHTHTHSLSLVLSRKHSFIFTQAHSNIHAYSLTYINSHQTYPELKTVKQYQQVKKLQKQQKQQKQQKKRNIEKKASCLQTRRECRNVLD